MKKHDLYRLGASFCQRHALEADRFCLICHLEAMGERIAKLEKQEQEARHE